MLVFDQNLHRENTTYAIPSEYVKDPFRVPMVFILYGAAGLRIGEVLGIEIDKHISSDFLTMSIVQKVRHGK